MQLLLSPERKYSDLNILERVKMKHKIGVILLVAILVSPVCSVQQPVEISYTDTSEMPPGKKGERIEALIQAINSAEPDQVRNLIINNFMQRFHTEERIQQHIGSIRNFRQETGGVDFHSIRTYEPERRNETIVILKDRNFSSWRAFTLRFDKTGDFLIAGISFNRARKPSNVTEVSLTEKQFIQEVRQIVAHLDQQEVFSGTLLIAKNDQVLLAEARGEASKRFHVPNNTATKFNLGSMNKMFTATAIVMLQERGKLKFNDPISKYVDESWLPREYTDKITIHQLLSHTSGLGSYFNRTYMEGSRELFRIVDDFKPLVQGDKPAFEPGKRFRYSNTGMLLLGVVIESITGGSYFDFVRENIFAPLGMNNTDCFEMDYPVENLAIGYSLDHNSPYKWQNNLYQHVIKGGPAGGGFSTVGDLFLFARAISAGKLVSRESLKTMWKNHAEANYGYGFTVVQGPTGKVVGHSGGFSGINSNLDIYLDKDYVVAVMSNISNGASPLADRISQLLTRVK